MAGNLPGTRHFQQSPARDAKELRPFFSIHKRFNHCCSVEHVGMVVSGRATAAMDDGRVIEMKPGDIFYIAPGHDSWVVGDEPYVSIHLMGASDYAKHR